MQYKTLGKTGVKVSSVCLGTMTFGDQVSDTDALLLTGAAIDAGVNFIDTANTYTKGRSEEIVGKALKGRRKDIVLATKVGMEAGPNLNDSGLSRKHIKHSVEESLRRLGTDYIDVYYAHRPDYVTPIEESLRAFDDLVREGKVLYLACSNFRSWQLCRALWACESHSLQRFECIQTPYNLVTRDIEYELLPLCTAEGLGVTVYNPLAAGMLTGKHDPSKPPAAGTRFSNETLGKLYHERYWNESNFAAVAQVKAIASDHNRDMAQLALAWILANPAITSIVIGATSLKHIENNVAAADLTLTEDELVRCNDVWNRLRPLRFFYGR